MTYKQFFTQLRKLKGKYELDESGQVRAKEDCTGYCPIVGVGRLKGSNDHFYSTNVMFLKLSDKQTNTILNAADSQASTRTERMLRRTMLKTLGLVERT